MAHERDVTGADSLKVEARRESVAGPLPVVEATASRDRAVAVASQADGLEHAVPLDEVTLARSRGEWPLALCATTVVPAALGASGRDCRRCRGLVLVGRRAVSRGRRSVWRRLLARLGMCHRR